MLRTVDLRRRRRRTRRQPTWCVTFFASFEEAGLQEVTHQFAGLQCLAAQMREIAEIELAIQGGTEKIEQLGEYWSTVMFPVF